MSELYIKDLLSDCKTVSEISLQLGISKQYIYRIINKNKWKHLIKKKKKITKLTEWSDKMFPLINEIVDKYHNKILMEGVSINKCDIECVILDLMIHTDQKNIKNKDAYFRKYCPLKVNNLKYLTISRNPKELTDYDKGEYYGHSSSPENILIMCEEFVKNSKI